MTLEPLKYRHEIFLVMIRNSDEFKNVCIPTHSVCYLAMYSSFGNFNQSISSLIREMSKRTSTCETNTKQ